jgi:hypothetical protein
MYRGRFDEQQSTEMTPGAPIKSEPHEDGVQAGLDPIGVAEQQSATQERVDAVAHVGIDGKQSAASSGRKETTVEDLLAIIDEMKRNEAEMKSQMAKSASSRQQNHVMELMGHNAGQKTKVKMVTAKKVTAVSETGEKAATKINSKAPRKKPPVDKKQTKEKAVRKKKESLPSDGALLVNQDGGKGENWTGTSGKASSVKAATSYDSQDTITEGGVGDSSFDMENDDDGGSLGSSSEMDYPVLMEIKSGFVEKQGERRCMLELLYEEDKGKFRVISAADAVVDDPSHRILKWIMEKKSASSVWRDQVAAKIEEVKDNGLFDDWRGWDDYVRRRVADGFLDKKCMEKVDMDDKKRKRREIYVEVDGSKSPLAKIKEGKCMNRVHDWKEETNKAWARNDGEIAYCLTGLTCGGEVQGGTCGKEFVADKKAAKNPKTCVVIGSNNPCIWCPDCNLALCRQCHCNYIEVPVKRSRKNVRMLTY